MTATLLPIHPDILASDCRARNISPNAMAFWSGNKPSGAQRRPAASPAATARPAASGLTAAQVDAAINKSLNIERERVQTIRATASEHGLQDLGEKFIQAGIPAETAVSALLSNRLQAMQDAALSPVNVEAAMKRASAKMKARMGGGR